MNTQLKVAFITGKIRQLQTAILYSHSTCLLKFPTSLANTLDTDETGCIWVTVKRPQQVVHEFDRSFPAALNYYKKGIPFYLNMVGIARLVVDPEEINQLPPNLVKEARSKDDLLLCIRIQEASYFENEPPSIPGFADRIIKSISSLFSYQGNHHRYIMNEEQNSFI